MKLKPEVLLRKILENNVLYLTENRTFLLSTEFFAYTKCFGRPLQFNKKGPQIYK